MTDRERFVRTLTGKPVDRVPFIKVFGGTNAILPQWETERPGLDREIDEILGFEGAYRGWDIAGVNMSLTQLDDPVVLEETPTQTITRLGDGSVRLARKGQDYHRQTLEWPVKDAKDWERVKAKHLQADDPTRFRPNWPEHAAELRQRSYPVQLTHGGVYGFARNVMGDERLMYALYDAPELVHDIMDSYTDMALAVWGKMVKDVDFDLIECWEDMASKNGSLISPATFREFMKPNYERIADFAASNGIEILLVDSDGYTDALADLMVEAGVTTMYPFEVGAGCDVARVRRKHPTFGIIGGLNKEAMAYGRDAIDAEVEKARDFISMGRYIPGPDHFVLSNVTWENYRHFMERMREVVMTTTPRQSD